MILEGKSAIITGGVRGIGRGIAEAFCKEGANVVLVYRSNDEAAEETGEISEEEVSEMQDEFEEEAQEEMTEEMSDQ